MKNKKIFQKSLLYGLIAGVLGGSIGGAFGNSMQLNSFYTGIIAGLTSIILWSALFPLLEKNLK